jgi:thiaminase/transcriptional activator TenA
VPDLWERATQHPFLAAVRDGTLPTAVFDTWLAQDHRFVGDLLWFQARLLARAPRAAQPVLATGAAALVDELAWFEWLAEERGLDLGAPAQPATLAYRRLLERLDGAGSADAMTALWALEKAYLDAWRFAAPGAQEYREVVGHWTAPAFAGYVDGLAAACSSLAGPLVDEVLAHEIAFWEMAWRR